MFTSEQIAEMTREQVVEATKKLDKKFNFEKPITAYTHEIDQAVNMLCDLVRRNEILNQQEGIDRAVASNAQRRI
jgi:hypothetical protein